MKILKRLMRWLPLIIIAAVMAPILLVMIVVAVQLLTPVDSFEFTSPSETRVFGIVNDCRFVGCVVSLSLDYRDDDDGRWKSMACNAAARRLQGKVPDDLERVKWSPDEGKVTWQGPTGDGGNDDQAEAAESVTVNLITECLHEVTVTNREHGLIAFRFGENCLIGPCYRQVVMINPGQEYLMTPCRIAATGNTLVFSTGDDSYPNVEVRYDPEAQTAGWESVSTGLKGVIDLKADCDRSRSWTELAPA